MPEPDALRSVVHALAHAASPLGPADVAAVALAAAIQRYAARFGLWVCALVALPGTIAHELAHHAVATILRAQPSLPSFVPRRTPDGWQLGEVAFRAGPLRAMPIAIAPLLLAPLALWLALHTLAAHRLDAAYVAWAWVCGALVHASLPSRQDWRVAAPGLLAIAVLVGLAVGVRYLVGAA